MRITGMVTDANGHGLDGAGVRIIAEPNPSLSVFPKDVSRQLGVVAAAKDGAFTITVPALPLGNLAGIKAVASLQGYGLAVVGLDPLREAQQISLTLEPEQPIKGRVTLPDGKPAADVTVRVMRLTEVRTDGQIPMSTSAAYAPLEADFCVLLTVSDKDGRFVLHGFPRLPHTPPAAGSSGAGFGRNSRNVEIEIAVNDPRFAPIERVNYFGGGRDSEGVFWVTGDAPEELDIRLAEGRMVDGAVLAQDSRKPIADAWVGMVFSDMNSTGDLQPFARWTRTNKEGRFHVRGGSGGKFCNAYVFPPDGVPYPAWVTESKTWHNGEKQREMTIEVPRGLLLHGQVIERESKQPVAGATVEYQVRRKATRHLNQNAILAIYWAAEYRMHRTDQDGRFQIAVIAAPASLMVKAPTSDFVSRLVQWGDFQLNAPGGVWYALEGLTSIDPKPSESRMDVTIPIVRGARVTGTLTGPDGKQVGDVMVFRNAPQHTISNQAGWSANWPELAANGVFELHGCDTDGPMPAHFLDVEHQWGATVDVGSRQTGSKPLSVTMQPCGAARARLVDQNGKPWAKTQVGPAPLNISMWFLFAEGKFNPTTPNQDHIHARYPLMSADWKRHNPNALITDELGAVTFPTLIPGASYRLFVRNPGSGIRINDPWYQEIRIKVLPGQIVDLGDVVVQREQ